MEVSPTPTPQFGGSMTGPEIVTTEPYDSRSNGPDQYGSKSQSSDPFGSESRIEPSRREPIIKAVRVGTKERHPSYPRGSDPRSHTLAPPREQVNPGETSRQESVEEEIIRPQRVRGGQLQATPKPEPYLEDPIDLYDTSEEDATISPVYIDPDYADYAEAPAEFDSSTNPSTGQIPSPQITDSKTDRLVQTTTVNPATARPNFIDGVNCDEYTDRTCLNQQEKHGIHTLHPCCHRKLYLTDICDPKTCSNDTYSLCCFQKFLQARYICCHNKELTGSETDEFNRCCYHRFVEPYPDPCCPSTEAQPYWNEKANLYELCMPNVDIDYSKIRLEATLSTGEERVLDLGGKEGKVLNYECPYGKTRETFFYWQPPKKEGNGTEF